MDATLFPASLSLVIPCFNEAGRVPLLMTGTKEFLSANSGDTEVLIVDDGSTDDTVALIAAHPVYQEFSGQIKVLRQHNTGKGGALAHGVAAAAGDYILTLDADMATAPSELWNWLKIWGGSIPLNTVFIGSREHPKSVIRKQGDRKVAGNIFNWVTRILTPLQLRDTQCGFKLYPAAAAKQYFAALQTPGWAHDVEILLRARQDGLAIEEMPITWRAVEGSKIRLFSDGYRMFQEVFRISRKVKAGKPKGME